MIKYNNFKTYDDENNTVIHDSDIGCRFVEIYDNENKLIKSYHQYLEGTEYNDAFDVKNISYENDNTKVIERDNNNDLISVKENFKNEKGNEVERLEDHVNIPIKDTDKFEPIIYRTDIEHYPVENIEIQKQITTTQYLSNKCSEGDTKNTKYSIDEKDLTISILEDQFNDGYDIFIEKKIEDNKTIVISTNGDQFKKCVYDENGNSIMSNIYRLYFVEMNEYNEDNRLIGSETHRIPQLKNEPDYTTFLSGQNIQYDVDDKNRIVRQETTAYSSSDEDKNAWFENNNGGLFKQFISKYKI